MIRVRVDSAQLPLDFELKARLFTTGVRSAVHQAAQAAFLNARREAPGKLGKVVRLDERADGFSLGSESKVVVFVENGTVRHLIEASGRTLRFMMAGKAVFAKRVQHPRTKPNPFLHRSVEHGERVFRASVRQLLLAFEH